MTDAGVLERAREPAASGAERRAWPALALVILAVAAFFGPRLLRGEVVFPHDNALQVGAASETGDEPAGFSDSSSFFLPEVSAHLGAPRSGWIATWTDAVEMGRPLIHSSGFGPAYLPARVLAWFTRDAFVLQTVLTVLTVLATGVFAFLFFRALALDPWACAIGALSAALGLPVVWWLTFPMNVAGFCWTFCALWLATRWLERGGVLPLLGLAFAVHAVLLSGYPQMTVWQGAFAACWTIARAWRRRAQGQRLAAVGALALAVLAGVACALPVLLDVRVALARSLREVVKPEYFLEILPELDSPRDVGRYLLTWIDPWLVGDPRAGTTYTGVSCGFLAALCALVSFLGGGWRSSRVALAFIAAGAGMTLFPGFYRFGVEHLGLSISRTIPVWGAIVPLVVCAALGADRLLRAPAPSRRAVLVAGGSAAVLALLALPFGEGVDIIPLALGFLGCAALALRRGPLGAVFAMLALFTGGRELVLMRPRESIRLDSPLVEEVRTRTAGGHRYALVGARPRSTLPANQELLLGLASVHAYDPLVSAPYWDWVLRVFQSESPAGKRFRRIQTPAALDAPDFAPANIALFLSQNKLGSSLLRPAGRAEPFWLYLPREEPWRARLVRRFRREPGTSDVATLPRAGATAVEPGESVTIETDLGDRMRLSFAPREAESLLWLSRQAHPQWRTSAGELVVIDGFYQGVIVPAGTRELELSFHPYVRWAWIPQALFVLAFGFAAAWPRFRRARVRASGVPQ